MPGLENRMLIDVEYGHPRNEEEGIPLCDCCEERIRQYRALHILAGKRKIWICDSCINDLKEITGFED